MRRSSCASIIRYTLKNIGLGVFLLFVLLASLYTYTRATTTGTIYAQSANTLNFQARLLTAGGAMVSDGDYSVEFRLYENGTGGSSIWDEQQTVSVKSGYLSVYLGSATTIPTDIDWSDQKYLTMNVEADGEMSPRIRLTAVPLAFQANRAGGLISGTDVLTADDLLQTAPTSIQSIAASVAGLRFNQTGSGGLIQLQGDGVDRFVVDKSGNATLNAGITVGTSSVTTAGTIRWSGTDLEVYDGSSWASLTSGGGPVGNVFEDGGNSFGGLAVLGTNDANALALRTDGVNRLFVDTAGNVGIGAGLSSPNERLQVDGGINIGISSSTNAGTLRWTGVDFEGYDGSGWVSLTGGSSPAVGTPATATFYDATGGATIASGVFSTINLDTTLTNSDNTKLSLAANEVTVDEDGFYEISYQVTTRLASGTRSGFNAKLQLDDGGGYADVAGSQAYHYGRITTETQGTSSATVILSLSAGDKIRVQGQGTSQQFATIANATSLTVTRVTSAGGVGSSGLEFTQGGDAFGTTALLGTTDNNGLRFITNNNIALDITASGDATFSNALDVDGLLTANNGLTFVSGNLNMGGGDIQNAGAITATSVSGNGSALTSINASNITTGTLNDARLSGNVALLNAGQTFTSLQNFSAGLTIGNTADTTAGNIRWNGADLEVYDGTDWVSLTSGGAVASPADYISETITANSSTATGPYDIFESGNYPSFSSVTNASDGITYTPADGRFTFDNGGTYNIQLNLFVENSNTSLINIIVRVNGANVFNQDTFVHNVVDPVERTVTLIQDVNAGDFVEFLVQGTTGTVTVNGGTSVTIVPVSAASGSGSGSSGLTFEQGGNAFGSLALLGTTDANGLQLITNGTAALAFTAAGNATFTGSLDIDGLLTVNNGLAFIAGNLNLGGGDIINAGNILATAISGNGSGLTNLNASTITTGILNDARLSGNVALLNTTQTFTSVQTFSGGTVLGNFVSTTAGAIRWTGSDFEGYDGTQWLSLTSGGSASLIEGVLAFGRIAGSGTPLSIDGASVVRNSAGDYTVTLNQPAANSNYTVSLSLEDASNFNDPNIVINNQTASSFDVYIGIGDNGATADVRSDRNWHFMVLDADATAGGGGGGGGGGGLVYEQGGNAFGATGIIGTTDANGLRLVSGANTALEFDVSGVGTFANGFSITSGAVDLNLNGIVDAGAISGVSTLTASGALSAATTGDTINGLVINGGSLSSITGYDQASGNFTIAGSGTFSTGTGTVNLNGDVIAGTTLQVNDGLSVAGSNSNVASIAYFEGNITTPSSVNNGTIFGPYTFDADNDPDEAAWTFVSDNGPNGLNPSGTNRAWSHQTGDTPSAGVGPTSGQGGSPDGYIYIEATSPAAAGDTFTVTNNTAFDASNEGLLVEFYWNQRGDSNLATLDVQTNENGAGWVTRGSYGGGDQLTDGPSVWNFEQLNLSGVVTDPSTEVRFLVTFPGAGTIWHNDFGLDTITITELEPDFYGDNIIEAYNANSVSDVDLLTLRSDVGGVGNVVFRVDSDGDIFSDGLSFIGGGADLAEMYKNNDGAQPGDVVVFVDSRTVARSSAVNQKAVAGIVSTYPGVVLDAHVKGVPVALSGRAPVNFSVENGAVEAGDYLMTGSNGTAVKAIATGTVIGRAMHAMSDSGSLDVMVGIGYYNASSNEVLQGGLTDAAGGVSSIDQLLDGDVIKINQETATIELGNLQITNGVAVSGGFNNNSGGLTNVGSVEGVSTLSAQVITIAASGDEPKTLVIQDDGIDAAVFMNNGALRFMLDDTRALSVGSASGEDVFRVDTQSGLVFIGDANSVAPILFVLSGSSSYEDPAGVNGAQYYNTVRSSFRCYEDGRWKDCISKVATDYLMLAQSIVHEQGAGREVASGIPELLIDLSGAWEVSLQVSASTNGAIGSVNCELEYTTGTINSWISMGEGVEINGSTGTIRSAWADIPEAGRTDDVRVRLACEAGQQSQVTLQSVRMQVR